MRVSGLAGLVLALDDAEEGGEQRQGTAVDGRSDAAVTGLDGHAGKFVGLGDG